MKSSLRRLYELGRPFRILAIETSCDDTAVAIIDSTKQILATLVSHQRAIHATHGGVVPYLAAEAHRRYLPQILYSALSTSQLQLHEVDVIAATRGPGIAGCLATGYNAGKLLAKCMNKNLISVHHMVNPNTLQLYPS